MGCLIRIKSDIKAGQDPSDPVIFHGGEIIKRTLTVALAMVERGEAIMIGGAPRPKRTQPNQPAQHQDPRRQEQRK